MQLTRTRSAVYALTLLAGLIVPLAAASPAAAAATIVVDENDDEINTDSDCSLREAVQTANTNAQVGGCVPVGTLGDDTIQLGSGVLYTLTKGPAGDDTADAGDLDITGNTTIVGGATSSTIVQMDRNVMLDRVFDVAASTTLNLSGFTIKDGKVGGGAHGGGIRSLGTLRLEFMAVNNNESVGGVGGGVYAGGALTMLHSSINSSIAGGNGGGGLAANSQTAEVEISGSSFNANQGTKGGAVNIGGPATIEESTFTSNTAPSGGALYSSNPSGTASVTVTDSTFFNNSNGAIANMDTLIAERVLLRDNTSSGAGTAFTNSGTATFTNSTISGNSSSQNASAFGSSIWTDGSAAGEETTTLRWTTVSNNRAPAPGGALTTHNGNLVLENSILANSSRSDPADTATNDCSVQDGGTVTILGTSILENPGACSPTGTNLAVDPQLEPLENYGGVFLTLTHALQPTSPALDAGGSTGCPATDQRSYSRPADGPDADLIAACDIGAYEARVISINDVTKYEGDSGVKAFEFTIEMSAPAPEQVRFFIQRLHGSTESADFSDCSPEFDCAGSLTLAPSETTTNFTVNVVGDIAAESDEVFDLVMDNFPPGTQNFLFADNDARGTIRDDDTATPHARTVSLTLRRHLRARGKVVVEDAYNNSRKTVSVKVQRKKPGGWKTVETVSTNLKGVYKTKLSDRPASYRAVAPAETLNFVRGPHLCSKATSSKTKHSH